MTPKFAFLLAVLGVAAAGAPLPWLTRPAPLPGGEPPAAAAAQNTVKSSTELTAVYARVQFTGAPQMLRLSVRGKRLAELSQEDARLLPEPGVWEPALLLPAPLTSLELEVQAQWDDEAPQAVTVSLEPPKQPARQATLWSLPGGMLADCCLFSW